MLTARRLAPLVGAALGLTAAVTLAQSNPTSDARPRRAAPATTNTSAPRASDAIFPTQPTVERLPNGLTVVTLPWSSPGIVAYYTMVRVGSRDEVETGHSGFAHFFEHVMFRGTERHSQEDWSRTMQSFGADTNAFTSTDYTCYTITAPTAALPSLVELESDRFQRLAYPESVFRTEAGAVRGEYQVWSSNPQQPMWEALSALAFTRHTYGHTTIGYLADIERMPEEYAYAQAFFRRYYTPDNTFVIVVGDFDRAALMTEIRSKYGGWRGRRDRPAIPAEPEPREGARRDLPWQGSTPPRVLVGWRTPAFEGTSTRAADRARALRESAALEVVHGLAFDASSPLYQRLVVGEQSVLELDSYESERARDPGLFVVEAELAPTGTLDATIDAFQAELAAIGAGQTPPERVRAVQEHLRYSLATNLETPASVAGLIAEMIAVTGRVDAVGEHLAALAAVTPDDVARVARTYLVPARRFVVTLQSTPAAGGGS